MATDDKTDDGKVKRKQAIFVVVNPKDNLKAFEDDVQYDGMDKSKLQSAHQKATAWLNSDEGRAAADCDAGIALITGLRREVETKVNIKG